MDMPLKGKIAGLVMVLTGTLGLAGISTSAQAVPLSTLLTGGSIQVDDKLFDGFRVTENNIAGDISGATEFNLDNIDILPWPDTGGEGPGLDFRSLNNELSITQFVTTPTGEGDLDFIFRVSVLDPKQAIVDNTLQAFFFGDTDCDPFLCDNFAEVRERLFLDAALTMPVTDLAGLAIEKDVHWGCDVSSGACPPPDDQSGQVIGRNFAPLTELWVVKDIRLLTANSGETVGIESFNQHFSQTHVPEPGSLALLGLGLRLIGRFARRRSAIRT